ncbi:hypothetical protein D3C76_464490 [compost metagenome]|uniref:Uncharacterized protein n=1 Tax=Paenibacillus rhizolycopersici TaxID=2780073 RepID=A0ABS2H6R8_9BACL|nr:hypothetical protein [Paenibacillus sp. J53TS2]MBM6995454.1 hypothetical protein [Paenibacillus rhizolycopersici]GIP48637.1 hypothetical protein J53TS2_22280 [Paenibacillus sp. J53TS2]
MKLRIGPIAASIAISVLVLFGGWFLYRQWAIERPLENIVKSVDGVNQVEMDIKPDELALKLSLKPGTDLGALVRQIEQNGKDQIGNRTLKLDVEDHSSPTLDLLWENALFTVAQAMENKQYTQITAALKQMEQENDKLTATAEMDEKNVYITLTDGQYSKFVILPRTPERMGAWPNA